MRSLTAAVVLVLLSVSSSGFASDKGAFQLAQASDKASCIAKCESQKEKCFGQYKKSDSTSGNYITPEGRTVCFEAYHACKANCPKK